MIFRKRRNTRRTPERALPLAQAQELVHAPIERAQELVHAPLERAHELMQAPMERAQGLVHAPVEKAQEIAQGVLPRRRRRRGRLLLLLALPAAVAVSALAYKKLTERKQPSDSAAGSSAAAASRQSPAPSAAAGDIGTPAPATPSAEPPPAAESQAAVLEGRSQEGRTASDFLGRKVIDVDGNELGEVEAVYNRGEGHPPEWAALRAGGINPRRVLVPLEDARVEQGEVIIPYTQELVREAPAVEEDSVEPELEQRLYSHYNLRRVTDASASTLTTGMGALRIMSTGRS